MADTVYKRKVVLLHGLFNNSSIFNRMISEIDQLKLDLFVPTLPHQYGKTSLVDLASEFNKQIFSKWNSPSDLTILGFSMGGLILRYWLQKHQGFSYTTKFITVGTPHNGTLTAQLIPSGIFIGISQMKYQSKFIKELNQDYSELDRINCISYLCKWDLMVFPGWKATLPIGKIKQLPVNTHRKLILDPIAIKIIIDEILL